MEIPNPVYKCSTLRNGEFEILVSNVDTEKNIVKQVLPIVICLGRTGNGKSTLLSGLSNTNDIFLSSSNFTSTTSNYTELVCLLKEKTVVLYDSIGFNDNTNSSDYLEKTAQFLLDLRDGVSVIIVAISIAENVMFQSNYVENAINLLGQGVESNILIVLTQANKLNQKEKEKRLNFGFSKKTIISSLKKSKIFIEEKQIVYFDLDNEVENIEAIKVIIEDIIDTKGAVTPESSLAINGFKKQFSENFIFLNKQDLLFVSILFAGYNSHKGLRLFFSKAIKEGNKIYEEKVKFFSEKYSSDKQNESMLVNKSLILYPDFTEWIKNNNQDKKNNLEEDNTDKIKKDIPKRTFFDRLFYGIKVLSKIGGSNVPMLLAPIQIQGQYLMYSVPVVGASIGAGFGVYRLVKEKGWKNKIFKSLTELVSGLTMGMSTVSGLAVGVGATLGIDTSLQIYDEVKNNKATKALREDDKDHVEDAKNNEIKEVSL